MVGWVVGSHAKPELYSGLVQLSGHSIDTFLQTGTFSIDDFKSASPASSKQVGGYLVSPDPLDAQQLEHERLQHMTTHDCWYAWAEPLGFADVLISAEMAKRAAAAHGFAIVVEAAGRPAAGEKQGVEAADVFGPKRAANLQKLVAALAHLLASKVSRYSYGDRPNISKIAEDLVAALPDGCRPSGLSDATIGPYVKTGERLLRDCVEQFDADAPSTDASDSE